MCISLPAEVNAFLHQFKFYAKSPPTFQFLEDRDVNFNSISELGIKPHQVREMILQLTPNNYISGPEKDKDYPKHNVWKFGMKLDGIELYIKLSDNFSHGVAKCISFHKAKFPLAYAYSEGGDLK